MKIKLTAAQRKAGVDLRDVMTNSERATWASFQSGAVAAANAADSYNSTSTHPYRLGDCILAKLNIGERKPRANKQRKLEENVQLPWMNGFAIALAEMHRRLLNGNDSTSVCAVARAAGLTLKAARSAGVSALDLKELKKAGIR